MVQQSIDTLLLNSVESFVIHIHTSLYYQHRSVMLVFGVCIVFTLNCPRPANTIEAGDAILDFYRWRQGPLNERSYTQ